MDVQQTLKFDRIGDVKPALPVQCQYSLVTIALDHSVKPVMTVVWGMTKGCVLKPQKFEQS